MNLSLLVLILSTGSIYLATAVMTPFYATYVGRLGGGFEAAGTAAAILFFVRGLASIIIGRIENKYKETEYFLVLGSFIRGFGFLGYIIAASSFHLGIISFFLGLADAIVYPAADALFSRHIDQGQDVSQWSWWEVTESWGTGLGALLGGFMATTMGFNFAFIFMALLSFLNAFLILLSPRKLL